MLKRAVSVERKTVSPFILDKSLEAAAETLADRREFRLSDKQYDAFVAALNSPIKPRPRLESLLATPSILECANSALSKSSDVSDGEILNPAK
jgi:uncharacterized protein (DUF1778 family)